MYVYITRYIRTGNKKNHLGELVMRITNVRLGGNLCVLAHNNLLCKTYMCVHSLLPLRVRKSFKQSRQSIFVSFSFFSFKHNFYYRLIYIRVLCIIEVETVLRKRVSTRKFLTRIRLYNSFTLCINEPHRPRLTCCLAIVAPFTKRYSDFRFHLY